MAKPLFPELQLQAIDENLTFAQGGRVIAWYLIPPRRSSFPLAAEFDQAIEDGGRRLAQLTGRTVTIRRTTRPYPVEAWARDVAADVMPAGHDLPAPGTAGVPLPGWPQHLAEEQKHLMGRTLATSEAYYGVELDSRPVTSRLAGRFGWHRTMEVHGLDKTRRDVDRVITAPGLNGRRATAGEVRWLLHRSVCLGLPAPLTLPAADGRWGDEDLAGLTDNVRWSCQPYDRTVKITAVVNGQTVTRHVAVVSMSTTVDPLHIPEEFEPWMQRSDRLGVPVEWVATVKPLPPQVTIGRMRQTAARIRSQVEHYVDEHHQKPPTDLARQDKRSSEVEDEMRHGTGGLNVRADLWARAAVSGDTEEEALDNAQQLAAEYYPQILLVGGFDQHGRAREFIPGEPLADVAYRRQFPVAKVAAAMPQATAQVGHTRGGIYLGATCGTSERAAMWDLHRSMEVDERSGATLLAGSLGSGKSVLLGMVAYKAVMAGVPTTILDPSERLHALTKLPELAPYSRHVPLMHAEPGTLNPYRVVAEPQRRHYEFDEDNNRRPANDAEALWMRARAEAAQQRSTLCTDALLGLIPANIAKTPAARLALVEAVRRVGGSYTRSPRDVIDELHKDESSHDELAGQIGRLLEDDAAMPQGALIFPSGDSFDQFDYDHRRTAQALLTVFTLKGLTLPPDGSKREDWSLDEMFSYPLMGMAAWLTQRSIYDRDPNERKLIEWDEAHVFTLESSGRMLVTKTFRETRKHNLRAIFASQNIGDAMTAKVGNFVDNAFVGRTEDVKAQAAAVQALGLPVGVGYEDELGRLSPVAAGSGEGEQTRKRGAREFIWSDGIGGIEKIRIDLAGTPRLLEALDTTADPHRNRRRVEAVA